MTSALRCNRAGCGWLKTDVFCQAPGEKDFAPDLDDMVKTSPQARPTVIRWAGGGKEVYITGSFNNWSCKIPLNKRSVRSPFHSAHSEQKVACHLMSLSSMYEKCFLFLKPQWFCCNLGAAWGWTSVQVLCWWPVAPWPIWGDYIYVYSALLLAFLCHKHSTVHTVCFWNILMSTSTITWAQYRAWYLYRHLCIPTYKQLPIVGVSTILTNGKKFCQLWRFKV